jgi:hypothetical protein
MIQVVGCGVVIVYLFLTLYMALVMHVQLLMINFVLYWFQLIVDVMQSGT